jgi:hypothetical protein
MKYAIHFTKKQKKPAPEEVRAAESAAGFAPVADERQVVAFHFASAPHR